MDDCHWRASHMLSSLPVPVEEFDPRVGDVVSLRSGGLFMTVLCIVGNLNFNTECLWFDM